MSYHYDREAASRRAYDNGVRAIASDLQRISTRDRHRMAMDARDRRLSPLGSKISGALHCWLGPLMGRDEMPDTNEMVEGVDRHNFHRMRKMVGDRVRKAMRRLGKDVDPAELEPLLSSLESDWSDEDGEEGEDHIFDRHATDEPEPFPGRPQPGGNMDPMRDFNDTRFPQTQTDPAKEPLNGDRRRPRRAHDAAPPSFADRFPFTTVATPGAVDWTKIS